MLPGRAHECAVDVGVAEFARIPVGVGRNSCEFRYPAVNRVLISICDFWVTVPSDLAGCVKMVGATLAGKLRPLFAELARVQPRMKRVIRMSSNIIHSFHEMNIRFTVSCRPADEMNPAAEPVKL